MSDAILVTGASGTIGSEVVRALLERGAEVRVAVHVRGKDGPARGRITTVEFDWDQPAGWERALAGVGRVFLAVPLSDRQVEYEAAFVDAARAAGVRHVVKLSAIDADRGGYTFARWHREGERRLEASGMAWTHVRPTFFMSNLLLYYPPQPDGNIYLPWGDAAVALVSPGDVGDVAATALTGDASAGQVYTPTGAEALTCAEIARTITEVTGRTIRYVEVPEEAVRQAMTAAGMPQWLVTGGLELHAFVRDGRGAKVTGDVRAVTRHEPRRFSDFALEHARHPAWTGARAAG